MLNKSLWFSLLTLVLILNFHCKKQEQEEIQINRPFPQTPTYTASYIAPNTISHDSLINLVKHYYSEWKSRYVKQCQDGTYYIDFNSHDPYVTTVSEAMGYGMMITVYMAGYDPDAKEIFDGLYQFYKKHPSNNCRYLMAWRQGQNCESTGYDVATDGDEDIAFALLLADAQWGSDGDINYKSEAINIINALKLCVFHRTGFPLLGDWAKDDPTYGTATRSSDWMLEHYQAFYQATNDAFWQLTQNKIIAIIDSIQKNYSPNTGLIPDFIVNASTYPQPAPPNFLESEYDGDVYYNACRTPWRLTTAQLFLNNQQLNQQIQKINNWIKNATNYDAQNIKAGYKLDGTPIHSFQDIAFTGGFAVAAMLSNDQQWINSCFNALMAPSMDDYSNDYYANTLRMLYLLVISGTYWIP